MKHRALAGFASVSKKTAVGRRAKIYMGRSRAKAGPLDREKIVKAGFLKAKDLLQPIEFPLREPRRYCFTGMGKKILWRSAKAAQQLNQELASCPAASEAP